MERPHPLDKLIKDDSLFLMEAMVPFVEYPYKKLFILLIKYKEITSILNSLDDRDYTISCGFDCHPQNSSDILDNFCSHLPSEFSNKISQIQQMMKTMDFMNSMQGINADATLDFCNGKKDNRESESLNLYSNVMDILNNSK